MKFRKKPVVIEAFKFKGWTGAQDYFPAWFPWDGDQCHAVGAHLFLPNHDELAPRNDVACLIRTPEGEMRADINDWIIKGIKGEFYPCKPDIFIATYDPVDDPSCVSIGVRTEQETAATAVAHSAPK